MKLLVFGTKNENKILTYTIMKLVVFCTKGWIGEQFCEIAK